MKDDRLEEGIPQKKTRRKDMDFQELYPPHELSTCLCKWLGLVGLGETFRVADGEFVEALIQPWMVEPSTSFPRAVRWALGVPTCLARSRALLSSMSRIASQSSLTTAASLRTLAAVPG